MTPRTVVASLPADMTVGEVSPTDLGYGFLEFLFLISMMKTLSALYKDELFKKAAEVWEKPNWVSLGVTLSAY